ncbi:MAG TPA: hypothetical protein VFX16_30885 [Pseudonocardiaceae bacterium]|nr:hypothetical protein [Pseudonocardiaceae bacterium]
MRLFGAERLCVSVEDIDFEDPNRPDYGRELGVRIELRTVEEDTAPSSIYASRPLAVARAVCRFDLLESAARAQDRMHWHPRMTDGVPCERVFDTGLRDDPTGFVRDQLNDAVSLLERCGVQAPQQFAGDADALVGIVDAIIADIGGALERLRREPWPPAPERDERGMPLVSRN